MGNIGTFNPALLVHGQQAVTLHRPIPVEGTATITSELVAMYDKVKAAVVVTELNTERDADGSQTELVVDGLVEALATRTGRAG